MREEPSTYLDNVVEVAFETRLSRLGLWPVTTERPATLQINLGYRCNQQCAHCHYRCGPDRKEAMSVEVMGAALEFAGGNAITDFDLTGGAPELHPDFRWLVETIGEQGGRITDRCNLTVLREPGNDDLPEFLAAHKVHVAASLPCYSPETTDRVRGRWAFARSVAALKMLNDAGYGRSDTGLELTLVHNPAGAALPGRQESLEIDYRKRLWEDHGVVFTRLITIANMPIGRLLGSLEMSGSLKRYIHELEQNFNQETLPGLMCRRILSVGWNGVLYDCDFNQSLGIAIRNGKVAHAGHTSVGKLLGRQIRCFNHCYGCTAGNGSSCGGEIATPKF